ncbi:hypothetical protein Tco_0999608 [Tanacetum coccineum]
MVMGGGCLEQEMRDKGGVFRIGGEGDVVVSGKDGVKWEGVFIKCDMPAGEGMELVLYAEGFERMYKPPQRMPWVMLKLLSYSASSREPGLADFKASPSLLHIDNSTTGLWVGRLISKSGCSSLGWLILVVQGMTNWVANQFVAFFLGVTLFVTISTDYSWSKCAPSRLCLCVL